VTESFNLVGRAYLGDYFEADVDTEAGRVRLVLPSDVPPPPVGSLCRVSALPGGVSFIP
jgi:putative spermidine/putrescine transport system ATP-binding protein